MTITTGNLILREFIKEDWQAVHEYASDPEVVHYMDWGPNTEKETRDFIERAMASYGETPRCDCQFAVILQEKDRLIGACGLHVSNRDHREGWIGYCFNRHYWKKGYATEAARRLLTFGFEKLKLHRIFATCDPQNRGSVSVLEKVGMRREGWLREHKWVKGKWRDSFLYAILNDEWKTGRDDSLA
ncbi:unnamed protein product [marine sediment metagenome]|uniref:N-acetyltransferase domain-containing protein n=1 Tax=marine sediment metagenome TaxID=412755 RepID=X1IFV3_9ZZZZ